MQLLFLERPFTRNVPRRVNSQLLNLRTMMDRSMTNVLGTYNQFHWLDGDHRELCRENQYGTR